MEPVSNVASVPTPRLSIGHANPEQGSVADFGSVVRQAKTPNQNGSAISAKDQAVIDDYTSIITTQFVGAILEEQSGLLDSGDGASKHYHSMMVEAVSDHLTRTDALGLRAIVEWELSK